MQSTPPNPPPTEAAEPVLDPAIRVMLLPRDTNAHGTIFGGVILSYIDLAGAIGAHRFGIGPMVTVAMNGVTFHEPVFVGDVLSLYSHPVRLGRTSITMRIRVEAERALMKHGVSAPNRVTVTEARVTYVAVDEHRRPTPIENLRPQIEAAIQAHARQHQPASASE